MQRISALLFDWCWTRPLISRPNQTPIMMRLIPIFHRSLIISFSMILPVLSMGQVGIGTTIPNASAKLDVSATDKGFLPPRVALQGTNDATLVTPRIASPATGLLVYNTATAGSGSTAVTPGLYYYDGVRWQRVINTVDATVTFNGTDPATATTFTDGPAASANYIYVSDTDNSQWTWNGTAYVTYNPPPSTAWMSSGGTTDAGSTKSGVIYRTGRVGIGTTTTPNASAQLDVNASNKGFLPPRVALKESTDATTIASPATGLLVYNTATAGTKPNDVIPGYYYYNGTSWVTIGNTTVEAWSSSIGSSPNITIGATTTAPTKANSRITDYIRYKKIGDKQYAVEMKYFVQNQSGSAAGSGDYLFTLPGGLRFSSVEHPYYTISTRYGDSWGYQILESNVILSYDNYYAIASVIPYDATRFRLALVAGGNAAGQFQYIGSSSYGLNYANITYNVAFKFYAQ